MNRERLVEQHLYIVNQLSQSLMRKNHDNPRLEQNDLRSAGYEALLLAGQSFDDSMGIPFEHYARKAVRHSMIKEIQNYSSKNTLLMGENYSFEEQHDDWEDHNNYWFETVREAMDRLSPEDRQFVEKRYGFYSNELKLREISESMNISVQAVDQRIRRILGKMRISLNENQFTYHKCA